MYVLERRDAGELGLYDTISVRMQAAVEWHSMLWQVLQQGRAKQVM